MNVTEAIIQRHDAFMSLNYPRYPIALVRGEGAMVWDAADKAYLDLFAGFGAPVLGHCHPDLVEAVTRQAGRLWHVGNLFHTEPQTRAAEAISKLGFGGRCFFSHSGADANEAAFKLARLYGHAHPGQAGPRYKVISTTQSFHGRSFATMPATGNPRVREGFEPLTPGFSNVAYNDVDAIRSEIDDQTVAVIVEPIQGEGGVNVPDAGYFPALRALCDEHDLLLIADEVWTGCGRTGRYFGYQLWDVEPDLMTLGKGVGGGLAVGVCCMKPEHAELFNARTQGGVKHATTLGGNCLGMAVTAAIFETIERDGLVQRAERLGDQAMSRLRGLGDRCGRIREVRGSGLFIGIALNIDNDPTYKTASDIVRVCLDAGLIINATGGDVLRLAPALTIGEDQLHRGLDILSDVLSA